MNIDRRVSRTRTALYDSLVALIIRKNYDEIGIQDILDEANVARSTFYAHFHSKDELLERSLERLRALLNDTQRHALEQGRLSATWSLAMFEHVAEYKRVYDVIVEKRAGDIVLKAQRNVLRGFLRDSDVLRRNDEIPRDFMIEYIAGAFMAVMKWWLDRRFSLPPNEIDSMFWRMLGEASVQQRPTSSTAPRRRPSSRR